jgi:hypothetical protein
MFLPDAGWTATESIPTTAGAVTGKAGQNPASSNTISKISDAASTTASDKTTAGDGANPLSSAHNVQTSGSSSNTPTSQAANQTAQSPVNGLQAKAVDNGAPAQAITAATAVQDSAARRAGDVGNGQHSTELTGAAVPIPRENGESTPTSAINSARLIQTMNETGMQVGMRSSEFGDISIRTSVSQQQMLAQISVDHGDLGKAIAMHVPAMQSKLGEEFGLRASIQVSQSGAGFSGEQGNSSSGQQRPYARSTQNENFPADAESLSPGVVAAAWDGNRLDVRA